MARVTSNEKCKHRIYENKRVRHLRECQLAERVLQVETTDCSDFEKAKGAHLMNLAVAFVEEAEFLLSDLSRKGTEMWRSADQLLETKGKPLFEELENLQLPSVRPLWADFTDAGPGVGVINVEVRFRDAELARLHKSDYRVRLHRSRGDSGQNEAERTNSAIGDNIVDGGTIDWNHFKKFDGLTDEDIEKMTLLGYQKHEAQRMRKNAWRVVSIVQERIDNAPVISGYITAMLAEENEDYNFFSNKEYLAKYIFASKCKKLNVPGAAYFGKIFNFFDQHYNHGELYMEFLFRDCKRTSQDCS